jgi:hypothetical protein
VSAYPLAASENEVFDPVPSPSLSLPAGSKPVNAETLSPFDATTYKGGKRVGQHLDIKGETSEDAFSIHLTTQRLSPRGALRVETGVVGRNAVFRLAGIAVRGLPRASTHPARALPRAWRRRIETRGASSGAGPGVSQNPAL